MDVIVVLNERLYQYSIVRSAEWTNLIPRTLCCEFLITIETFEAMFCIVVLEGALVDGRKRANAVNQNLFQCILRSELTTTFGAVWVFMFRPEMLRR